MIERPMVAPPPPPPLLADVAPGPSAALRPRRLRSRQRRTSPHARRSSIYDEAAGALAAEPPLSTTCGGGVRAGTATTRARDPGCER